MKCFAAVISLLFKKKKKITESMTSKEHAGQDWSNDAWEDFSVKVISNDEMEVEQDIFGDMTPVFKKAKKV